ncbi:MAG: pyridoxamine 5'-phosphate oxidase family protein [Eubacterium sp.]
MDSMDYMKILVEDIHSTVVATIGNDGHPVTRCIDMMLWDEKGVYFLTARGKEFYSQLMEQQYISLSAIENKRCISLAGSVENIGTEKLDEIFQKNSYMQAIYPGDSRAALEVFRIYDAEGNFFDISDPAHVTRGTFTAGRCFSSLLQFGWEWKAVRKCRRQPQT